MSGANFSLFLLAAFIIAAIPGPGILYVAARTLSDGKTTGFASTFGTALGGLVHVVAGALGVSAIILASAQLFTALKLAGALYLIWLGIKTFRDAGIAPPDQPAGTKRAFRDGVVVEALNPKTAAFFLAFIPQFIEIEPAAGAIALQFAALGLISVALNTCADIVVVVLVSTVRANLVRKPRWIQRLRQGSGLFIAGLGLSLALTRRPAAG